MFVDDQGKMCGGAANTLTVRISVDELQQLGNGEILKGKNTSGEGTQIMLMIEENPQAISAS